MKYCLGVHSKYKIGDGKNETKLPTKLAYKNRLHDCIIQKSKTGWTCPISEWQYKDADLNHFLNKISPVKQQDKGRIPALILESWIKNYSMELKK